MDTIRKQICDNIHLFVLKHIDEITDSYDTLGFKNSSDMLHQIQHNISVALWALTELCWWGLDRDYTSEKFLYDRTNDFDIYTLDGNIYFRVIWDENNNLDVKQMHKIPKTIYIWNEL